MAARAGRQDGSRCGLRKKQCMCQNMPFLCQGVPQGILLGELLTASVCRGRRLVRHVRVEDANGDCRSCGPMSGEEDGSWMVGNSSKDLAKTSQKPAIAGVTPPQVSVWGQKPVGERMDDLPIWQWANP